MSKANAPARSTEEVFRDHLALRAAGDVERDIERNYAETVVICSAYGRFEGHDGVHRCAQMLRDQIGAARVAYKTCLVQDEIAFLEWTAHDSSVTVEDGVDTFLIRDGKIVIKTIHYRVQRIRT